MKKTLKTTRFRINPPEMKGNRSTVYDFPDLLLLSIEKLEAEVFTGGDFNV
jgi:hypothetical protein